MKASRGWLTPSLALFVECGLGKYGATLRQFLWVVRLRNGAAGRNRSRQDRRKTPYPHFVVVIVVVPGRLCHGSHSVRSMAVCTIGLTGSQHRPLGVDAGQDSGTTSTSRHISRPVRPSPDGKWEALIHNRKQYDFFVEHLMGAVPAEVEHAAAETDIHAAVRRG